MNLDEEIDMHFQKHGLCVCKYLFVYTLYIHVVDMVACFEHFPRFDCVVHVLFNFRIPAFL